MRYLWYSMYTLVGALAVYALFFRPAAAPPPVPQPDASPIAIVEVEPVVQDQVAVDADVQIALILDTSSSMDGLVAQARTQLWEMVAEMQIDEDGKERTVAVALYQYGNNRLSKSQGFIEQLTPLTTDLDKVTVKLHALRTSGGKEHAPQAIKTAVDELAWNDDDAVERFIVIAGNEGFSQGSIRPEVALAAAEAKSILVMPIYCANKGASRVAVSSWRQASELAGTDFDSIDPDQQVAKAETPFDAEILRKYQELEETKIYAEGTRRSQYSEQALKCNVGSVAIDRAVVQSRQADSADIVSAYGSGSYNLESAPAAKMPTALRGKSREQQAKVLQENSTRRAALKKEINELSRQRQSHISKGQKDVAGDYVNRKSNLGASFKKQARKSRSSQSGVIKSY